jgi:hypothetical protein
VTLTYRRMLYRSISAGVVVVRTSATSCSSTPAPPPTAAAEVAYPFPAAPFTTTCLSRSRVFICGGGICTCTMYPCPLFGSRQYMGNMYRLLAVAGMSALLTCRAVRPAAAARSRSSLMSTVG